MEILPPVGQPPTFVRGSALLENAHAFALSAHHGPARDGDTGIDHPEAVAQLLHEHGFEEPVVAAALLHDVIEDTSIDAGEIERDFGEEVAALVAEMTEDEGIEPYAERKAEHRGRVSRDRRAAAIYAADKVVNARWMKSQRESPDHEKLEHYRQTLATLCEAHPDLPFLQDLRAELEGL